MQMEDWLEPKQGASRERRELIGGSESEEWRETRPQLVPMHSVVVLLAPSSLGAVRVLPLAGLVALTEEGRVELRLHALEACHHSVSST